MRYGNDKCEILRRSLRRGNDEVLKKLNHEKVR